jgi:hypothetical protein
MCVHCFHFLNLLWRVPSSLSSKRGATSFFPHQDKKNTATTKSPNFAIFCGAGAAFPPFSPLRSFCSPAFQNSFFLHPSRSSDCITVATDGPRVRRAYLQSTLFIKEKPHEKTKKKTIDKQRNEIGEREREPEGR